MLGKVHSIESFGTVDGPGIRMVVFLKGCSMRCLYCHNPDTWSNEGATLYSAEQILDIYRKNAPFYAQGGLTVSGGEPLLQAEFIDELFSKAHLEGIHTALDTSGITFNPEDTSLIDSILKNTDLVLLDLKQIDSKKHLELTSCSNENILKFAKYLSLKMIPVWIRHVVVKGYTLEKDSLEELGKFIAPLKNVKAIDVLPYHDLGKFKYQQLGINYPLKDAPVVSEEEAKEAKSIILKAIKKYRN